MKKTLLILLLTIFTITVGNAQDDDFEVLGFGENQEEKDKMTDFLGFMLLPGSSSLVRYYEVHFNYNGTIKYTQLTMDSFMNRCAGRERSMANPTRANFFETYGIKDPNIVGQLWKLRYMEYPYKRMDNDTLGWSNNVEYPEMPSQEQLAMLKQYGITRVQDLCYGHNMFMLLKDMSNNQWIARYKGSAASTAIQPGIINNEGETFIDAE
ncbi:MAG: hypothetical protein IKQ30_00385 [Bacteroidales bacterium]|jgi:hypothetical protein|nr:hypothetical protein [Bacteroidales bacterium]MBR4271278.1 hypothetical protein [Bacteroidales bacterium]